MDTNITNHLSVPSVASCSSLGSLRAMINRAPNYNIRRDFDGRNVPSMKTHLDGIETSGQCALNQPACFSAAAALQFLTPDDLEEMQTAISKGALPPDFETKLVRLANDTLLHQFVEQNCRLFAGLLVAAHTSSFIDATAAAQARLLRVLAYVRKENDQVPDYKPGGFMDDLREVRAAATELTNLLQAFKVWRLRHQVPSLWTG